MDIIVCVKQVIAGDQVRFNPQTHSVVRSAEASRINPFDLFALDMAVRLKKEYSGSLTAVTMGPRISEEVLWEALALGADRAVLLSDPRFAASDTLATSYVLGMGIRKIGRFDLILCGMRTADSDTGQVGPQLAEELDVTHITGVEKLERREGLFRAERVSDGFREILEVSGPALLTVSSRRGMPPPQFDSDPGCVHPDLHRLLGSGRFGGGSREGWQRRLLHMGGKIDSCDATEDLRLH